MDVCIVNVSGGGLSAAEIDAYKRRALERYGRMPCRIDIRVAGDEDGRTLSFTRLCLVR